MFHKRVLSSAGEGLLRRDFENGKELIEKIFL
jgi:hypothetical protein